MPSENVRLYLEKLAQLCHLPDGAPEWDALAEEMDGLWRTLAPDEAAQVNVAKLPFRRYPANIADTMTEMNRLTQLGSTSASELPRSDTAGPYLDWPTGPQVSRAQRRAEASKARKSPRDGGGLSTATNKVLVSPRKVE